MNDKIQKVKFKLLDLGYLDNEWLSKYLEMLELNLDTHRNRKSTQAHHAIPVSSYWTSERPYDRRIAESYAKQDTYNFKVNLLYKDHLLIHSYLTLCTDLNLVQQQYEAQASLRATNGQKGAIVANQTLNKKVSGKYKRASSNYIQQYYSANEAEEILNL